MLHRVPLWILFLLSLNWIFAAGFERIDPLAQQGRSLSSGMDRFDTPNHVLFLGDSRTHGGADPRVFEATVKELIEREVQSLNLGRSGMQTPFFYYTLQNYLEEAEDPPEVIFVNSSYYLLSGYGWMTKIYLTSFQPTPAQAYDAWKSGLLTPWTAASWPIHSRIPLLSHLPASNTHLMLMVNPDPTEALEPLEDNRYLEYTIYSDERRGFLERGGDDEHIEPHWKSVGRVFNPGRANPLYLDYFRRFLALAEEHGVTVVLYEFPWPPAHNTQHDRETIAYYQKIMKRIGSEFSNFRFQTYHHFMGHEYFADPLHLNNRGAAIHSARLANWYVSLSNDVAGQGEAE